MKSTLVPIAVALASITGTLAESIQYFDQLFALERGDLSERGWNEWLKHDLSTFTDPSPPSDYDEHIILLEPSSSANAPDLIKLASATEIEAKDLVKIKKGDLLKLEGK
ncbi:Uu.00g007570.m01.CDS01 [Anthostomella pinea]|uniref:Uu.00g007570.m01.CDS01 n=1 Tax=Anthostomella pinea TaxID=933095 RepID=A0AAI8VX24_9PEZI|nr:Uu.00g007570.m01.CDS01 [Anthostomella pinea]